MQFTLNRSFVEFNSFSFGIAATSPIFIIEPASFETGNNGECYIAAPNQVSVRLELEMLDASLSNLLDCNGHPKLISKSFFETSGQLFLEELDACNQSTGRVCQLDVANINPNIGYEDVPKVGRRLVVFFNLNAPQKGAYLTLKEV